MLLNSRGLVHGAEKIGSQLIEKKKEKTPVHLV